MAFFVGQQVVCVFDRKCWDAPVCDPGFSGPSQYPKKGDVFTVAFITQWGRLLLLGFAERPEIEGWDSRAFRPVKDTTQQIEKLKRILLPKRQRESA